MSSLYDEIDGAAVFRRLVDDFYAGVADDPVLLDRPGRGYADDYTPWLVEGVEGTFVTARAIGLADEGVLAVAA